MSHASLRRSNQKVERHLHLARELAVRYSRRTGYDMDDLRHVGLLGLIKASRSYRPQTKVPSRSMPDHISAAKSFITFAMV